MAIIPNSPKIRFEDDRVRKLEDCQKILPIDLFSKSILSSDHGGVKIMGTSSHASICVTS